MTTTGRQALDYAERTLGVHQVYTDVQATAARLAETREKLATMRHEKAVAEDAYLTAEYNFVAETRTQMSELSQTAFDKAIKAAVHNEPGLRAVRAELAQRSTNIELTEASIARMRVDVEIGISRMTELGGYFAYLAAIKNAETARLIPPSADGDWPPASAVAGATTPATPVTPTPPVR